MFTHITAEFTGFSRPVVDTEVQHDFSHDEIINFIVNEFSGWGFSEHTEEGTHLRMDDEAEHPYSLTHLKFTKKDHNCNATLYTTDRAASTLKTVSTRLQGTIGSLFKN